MAPVTGKVDGFTTMFSSLQFNLKDLIASAEEIKTEKTRPPSQPPTRRSVGVRTTSAANYPSSAK